MTHDPTDSAPAPPPETPNRMSDALRYARDGWRVIPVYPGEKRPRLADWPTKATTDTEVIRDWWVQMPDSNIGIATGRGSGFFVLDIDPKGKGDEALAALEAQHGQLPYTFTVRTGSGGTHYYFTMPEDFEPTNSPGRLKGTGIDVRGEGGQVLAPPSRTVVGEYRVKTSAAIVAAPDWLLDLIRPAVELRVVGGESVSRIPAEDFDRQRHYAVNAALPAAVQAVAAAPEGQRNQTLNDNVLSLAGIAAHHEMLLSVDEVFDAMEAAAADLIRDDGRRAFSQTFESAWSAGLARPRADWPPRDRNAGIDFGPAPAAGGLPVVNITNRELHHLVDEVMTNIVISNHDAPELFMHGDDTVTVVGEPARTEPLGLDQLAYQAAARMRFVRDMPKGGQAVAHPPERVVKTVATSPEKHLPRLDRISFTPFFTPSGRLVTEPDYNEESRTFHSPDAGLVVPAIPEAPTPAEVAAARSLILDDLLVDFPFAAEADRTHAVALLLLPFVRNLIKGATPLHDIEAPTPGSGKGLLMKVLLMPGVGPRQSVMSAAENDEEWQKRLFAYLRDSPQAIVVDNVNTKIDSAALCTVLTEPYYSSRPLGTSQWVSLPVRCVWVLTGNNPQFSGEVSRRCLRIRVDPHVERPEERSGFRHADLATWAADHRGELIAAACTLVRSWVLAGMPRSSATWGSFEEWAAVMGGVVEHLGLGDFLGNRRDFIASADEESAAWDHLVTMLDSIILPSGLAPSWSAAELAAMVEDSGIAIDLGRSTNKALAMGRLLSKQRDRWHKGQQFESKLVRGQTRWSLTKRPDL